MAKELTWPESEPSGVQIHGDEWIDYNEVWAFAIADNRMTAVVLYKPKDLRFDFPAHMISMMVDELI